MAYSDLTGVEVGAAAAASSKSHKQLPLWLRDGLEKLKAEKQRQQQQQHHGKDEESNARSVELELTAADESVEVPSPRPQRPQRVASVFARHDDDDSGGDDNKTDAENKTKKKEKGEEEEEKAEDAKRLAVEEPRALTVQPVLPKTNVFRQASTSFGTGKAAEGGKANDRENKERTSSSSSVSGSKEKEKGAYQLSEDEKQEIIVSIIESNILHSHCMQCAISELKLNCGIASRCCAFS